MQFKKKLQILLTSARGKLPTIVFVWYVIWVSAAMFTIALVVYWYSIFYDIVYNQSNTSLQREYKHIIDSEELEQVLKVYDLE